MIGAVGGRRKRKGAAAKGGRLVTSIVNQGGRGITVQGGRGAPGAFAIAFPGEPGQPGQSGFAFVPGLGVIRGRGRKQGVRVRKGRNTRKSSRKMTERKEARRIMVGRGSGVISGVGPIIRGGLVRENPIQAFIEKTVAAALQSAVRGKDMEHVTLGGRGGRGGRGLVLTGGNGRKGSSSAIVTSFTTTSGNGGGEGTQEFFFTNVEEGRKRKMVRKKVAKGKGKKL